MKTIKYSQLFLQYSIIIALYSHCPFGYFWDIDTCLCPGWPGQLYLLMYLRWQAHTTAHSICWLRWGLPSFFPALPQTAVLLICAFWVGGITGMSHCAWFAFCRFNIELHIQNNFFFLWIANSLAIYKEVPSFTFQQFQLHMVNFSLIILGVKIP
jgi:hypothetical protein